MIQIKRYENRKLYDTCSKTYVTLDEIGKFIRSGEDVQIIDHRTGLDITASVMAQLIFEVEKEGTGTFPRIFLKQLIRLGDQKAQSLQDHYKAFSNPVHFFESTLKHRISILVSENEISRNAAEKLIDKLCEKREWPDGLTVQNQEQVDYSQVLELKTRIEQLNQEVRLLLSKAE